MLETKKNKGMHEDAGGTSSPEPTPAAFGLRTAQSLRGLRRCRLSGGSRAAPQSLARAGQVRLSSASTPAAPPPSSFDGGDVAGVAVEDDRPQRDDGLVHAKPSACRSSRRDRAGRPRAWPVGRARRCSNATAKDGRHDRRRDASGSSGRWARAAGPTARRVATPRVEPRRRDRRAVRARQPHRQRRGGRPAGGSPGVRPRTRGSCPTILARGAAGRARPRPCRSGIRRPTPPFTNRMSLRLALLGSLAPGGRVGDKSALRTALTSLPRTPAMKEEPPWIMASRRPRSRATFSDSTPTAGGEDGGQVRLDRPGGPAGSPAAVAHGPRSEAGFEPIPAVVAHSSGRGGFS